MHKVKHKNKQEEIEEKETTTTTTTIGRSDKPLRTINFWLGLPPTLVSAIFRPWSTVGRAKTPLPKGFNSCVLNLHGLKLLINLLPILSFLSQNLLPRPCLSKWVNPFSLSHIPILPFIAHRQSTRLQNKPRPPATWSNLAPNVGLAFLPVPIVGIRATAGAEPNNPPLSLKTPAAAVGAESPPLRRHKALIRNPTVRFVGARLRIEKASSSFPVPPLEAPGGFLGGGPIVGVVAGGVPIGAVAVGAEAAAEAVAVTVEFLGGALARTCGEDDGILVGEGGVGLGGKLGEGVGLGLLLLGLGGGGDGEGREVGEGLGGVLDRVLSKEFGFVFLGIEGPRAGL
ncbi:hypothetical protein CR513_08456, partial [Mucuna pruriens]